MYALHILLVAHPDCDSTVAAAQFCWNSLYQEVCGSNISFKTHTDCVRQHFFRPLSYQDRAGAWNHPMPPLWHDQTMPLACLTYVSLITTQASSGRLYFNFSHFQGQDRGLLTGLTGPRRPTACASCSALIRAAQLASTPGGTTSMCSSIEITTPLERRRRRPGTSRLRQHLFTFKFEVECRV